MRSIIGLALLVTGLSIGAYAYYPQTVQQHVDLANITRVIAPVASAKQAPPPQTALNRVARPHQAPDLRSFSPGQRLVVPSRAARASNHQVGRPMPALVAPRPSAQITTASIQRAPAPAVTRSTGWTTVVTPVLPPASGTRPVRSSLPADASAKYALIRDIQRELKRVGCYWGKIDGDWGPGSRRAIEGFVRTVNAALPTRQPDYILLALVRAQNQQVCGTPRERTIIATTNSNANRRTARKANPPAPVAVVTSNHRVTRIAPKPRLAENKRRAIRAGVPKPKPATAYHVATVKSDPARQRNANPGRKPAPPGRMAVGGPKPSELDATQTAPAARSSLPATTTYKKRARPGPAPRRAKAKKRKRPTRVASVKKKKKRTRRYKRSRRSNPLRGLLTQGVH